MKHLTFLCFFLTQLFASANNIQLDSLELKDSITVTLHVSWENSWNLSSGDPGNHDAAWLFLKIKSSGQWSHLDLASTMHSSSDTSLIINAASDGKGIFIKRKSYGEGNNSTHLEIRLNSALPPGNYDITAFALEMAFIPSSPFYIGDSASNNSFRVASTLGPYQVLSENMIHVDSTGSALDNRVGSPPASDIPATYPKGFNGFYLMKYEISQEQYVDFLNTLTYAQQSARTAASPSSAAGSFIMNSTLQQANRNSITVKTPGSSTIPAIYSVNADNDAMFNEASDGANRACNFLSWQDLTAYLDWACLRPMTEFEFEKAARGPGYPLPRGFAWGTDKVSDANTIQNDGSGSETTAEKGDTITGVASHGYAGPAGPLRCGFNGSQSSTRNESGASYYGCFELSGNLWEQCVSLSTAGLSFTGSPGNGSLSVSGNADVNGWDTSGNGVAIRGGGWNSGIQPGFRDLAVSDRFYGYFNTSVRRNTTGGRGCRTF